MVLILSVLIGITLDLTGAKPAVKYYASKYDHIDVEAILNNRRMVNYYSACLVSQGPCPPEGVEFKRILPEALHTNCERCSEKQATVALRAIKRLKKEYPKIWSQLSEMWDPDDIYVKKFESTFGSKSGPPKPPQGPSLVVNRFDSGDDKPTDNAIDGNLAQSPITDQPTSSPTNQKDSTTYKVITSTNTSPSFIIHSTTKTEFPYEATQPSSTPSTTKTTSRSTTRTTSRTTSRITTSTRTSTRSSSNAAPTVSSTTRSTTTTRVPPPIPGLLPLNTFFTNPPIPIRPIGSLNIGANIGATVSGLVRGLGAIGSRVMETGAEIAEVVIKNLARPLSL